MSCTFCWHSPRYCIRLKLWAALASTPSRFSFLTTQEMSLCWAQPILPTLTQPTRMARPRLRSNTPVRTPDRPVHPGNLIQLSVTGAGATNPFMPEGQLPGSASTVMPSAVLTAAIGGKDGRVVSQTIYSSLCFQTTPVYRANSAAIGTNQHARQRAGMPNPLHLPPWLVGSFHTRNLRVARNGKCTLPLA